MSLSATTTSSSSSSTTTSITTTDGTKVDKEASLSVTTTTSSSSSTITSTISITTTDGTKDATEAKEIFVNYFAIGSMINPVSINLRDIHPIKTFPAELYGYELVFIGFAGMASIEQKQDAVTHGVVHVITAKEMEALDRMESIYLRLPCEVRLYDGSTMTASVYQMDPAKRTTKEVVNNPPSERYIDIITRGAVHFGIKSEFTKWLSTVKVTPRKHPSEFKKLAEPENLISVTWKELEKYDGNDGRDLMFAVNYKVVKFVGDLSTQEAKNAFENMKRRAAGKDYTCMAARGLYEPNYPIAKSLAEMSDEHKAWVEDLFCSWFIPNYYKVVGRITESKI